MKTNPLDSPFAAAAPAAAPAAAARLDYGAPPDLDDMPRGQQSALNKLLAAVYRDREAVDADRDTLGAHLCILDEIIRRALNKAPEDWDLEKMRVQRDLVERSRRTPAQAELEHLVEARTAQLQVQVDAIADSVAMLVAGFQRMSPPAAPATEASSPAPAPDRTQPPVHEAPPVPEAPRVLAPGELDPDGEADELAPLPAN